MAANIPKIVQYCVSRYEQHSQFYCEAVILSEASRYKAVIFESHVIDVSPCM